VRFIPVNLCCSYPTIEEANPPNALRLSLSSRSELFAKPLDVANGFTNGDEFDLLDVTDKLEEHISL